MKITRIAVHILFVASIVLFFTRSSWVPNLVQFILRNEMNQALIAEPRSPLEASYVFGSGLKAAVITLANGAYEEKGVAGVWISALLKYLVNQCTVTLMQTVTTTQCS